MLVLSQEDVVRLLPMGECIDVMVQALSTLARGDALLPLRTVVRLPEPGNAFAVMPAYLGAPAAIGAKVITIFPGNHGTAFDSHQGAVLLFDTVHGSLQALLDATAVTSIRTAAVSAVATRLLAREDADEVAILGSGVQARMHIEAIPLVRRIKRVRVWSRNIDHARGLARFASEHLGFEVEVAETAERAVRDAGIVCTTTSARQPVLQGEWLAPGTHVNAIGASAPDAREIDSQTVTRSRLYVDRRESALNEPGDILVPLTEGAITRSHIVGELGELLMGTAVGRRDADEITLFKSLGLAIEDLAAACHVVERARAMRVGSEIDLGGRRDADS
jgi:ornithine cyclodeaminase/alanine dehydrogenase-like protein (mu-crystallin family)